MLPVSSILQKVELQGKLLPLLVVETNIVVTCFHLFAATTRDNNAMDRQNLGLLALLFFLTTNSSYRLNQTSTLVNATTSQRHT